MRLFLSSQNLGKYPEVFYELAGSNKKLAFCENAKDDWSIKDRIAKVNEHLAQFEAAGFEVQELDLRKFFGKEAALNKRLEKYGSVWMSGGNSFILRRAMAASGFDKILKRMLAEDSLVYGGSSAGSCVVAPSLHGIENGDSPNPNLVPDNYPDKTINWQGLNLVPFIIVPHYQSNWFKKEADATISYFNKHKIEHRILKDGQVILIRGTKEELLP